MVGAEEKSQQMKELWRKNCREREREREREFLQNLFLASLTVPFNICL
jgi:hypothetical protein